MTDLRKSIRDIATEARPVVEQWLDAAEQLAAFGETCRDQGIEWAPIKALVKASILDERDDAGDGKRVAALIEKADNAVAYADLLGLSRNLTNEKFSSVSSTSRPEAVAKSAAHIDTPATAMESAQASAESTDAGGMQDRCESIPPSPSLSRPQVTTGETAADSCGSDDASSRLTAMPEGPSIDGAVLACGPQETHSASRRALSAVGDTVADPVCEESIGTPIRDQLQGGAAVARLAHNQEVGGSNPLPASINTSEMPDIPPTLDRRPKAIASA